MGRMIEFNNILAPRRLRIFALAVVSAAFLSACFQSTKDAASAPTSTAPNLAPTLSGNPAGTVNVGVAYAFSPSARDPEGATLSFSIQNKPAWASFSAANGALTGTPTAADVGTTSNIIISTSDGTQTVALPAFSLTVSAAVASGTMQIDWTAPTANSDGSALADLAGFRIYYGTTSTALTNSVDVPGSSASSYTVRNLSAGTYFFSVSAYSSAGAESALSNPVSGVAL
jgi:Fibronectin type III domain